MGKGEKSLHQQHQQQSHETHNACGFICPECSRFFNRIAQELNFRCVFVLILGLSVFLSGIFWILPRHSVKFGFDAKQEIKLAATVQAYFRLEKPVRELVPHIGLLEYDINGEIGVPDTKVAILSMHQYGASNWTDVVFGVLSDPVNVPIAPVSVSVLRSSLVELFLKRSNLTLTESMFGQPYMFEILKCPGGVTVIPGQAASIWQIPQILFNFTLNNSITEIVDNFGELKEQLRFGLHLRPSEDVFLQVTNSLGSTTDSPVEVQASLMSAFGGLLPQRLKQLAQTITGSPARNLGLDNTVFGKVKSIRLSSFLKGTLSATPIPSPAPSPELSDYAGPSISPNPAPTVYSPAPSPSKTGHPPRPCLYHGPEVPPNSSPTPHSNPNAPPTYAPSTSPYSPSLSPSSQVAPHVSPAPVMFYANPGFKRSARGLRSPSPAPSPSSLAVGPFYKEIQLLGCCGLLIFHLFCW
ncbi:uncharacterized protein LOC126793529 [Argentina anserina]|uniref:uncharacterized protein LOC126793529 n=1 Tax=Argentina anserina TaxID=57926 RepID=UPI00217688E9|nr:uncharacterized protein LOC126793529 [Potentilla anserina]